MECRQVIFSGHALQRMFERGIPREDVVAAIGSGEIVEEYANDLPFPSGLVLGFADRMPLHVVVAVDLETESCYIVTVYSPDPVRWHGDLKTRRSE